MAESIPKAKSAYAFFQAAMNKQMVGVPLGITPASHLESRRLRLKIPPAIGLRTTSTAR